MFLVAINRTSRSEQHVSFQTATLTQVVVSNTAKEQCANTVSPKSSGRWFRAAGSPCHLGHVFPLPENATSLSRCTADLPFCLISRWHAAGTADQRNGGSDMLTPPVPPAHLRSRRACMEPACWRAACWVTLDHSSPLPPVLHELSPKGCASW